MSRSFEKKMLAKKKISPFNIIYSPPSKMSFEEVESALERGALLPEDIPGVLLLLYGSLVRIGPTLISEEGRQRIVEWKGGEATSFFEQSPAVVRAVLGDYGLQDDEDLQEFLEGSLLIPGEALAGVLAAGAEDAPGKSGPPASAIQHRAAEAIVYLACVAFIQRCKEENETLDREVAELKRDMEADSVRALAEIRAIEDRNRNMRNQIDSIARVTAMLEGGEIGEDELAQLEEQVETALKQLR